MSSRTRLSILICTHNRLPVLKECLEAIFHGAKGLAGRFEVVVVDNRSDDGTFCFLEETKTRIDSKVVRLITCFEERPGKSAALISGLNRISGEYILFLDDDNLLPADWSDTIERLLLQYPHHVIGSINHYLGANRPPWWEELQFAYACGNQSDGRNEGFAQGAIWGAGMIVPACAVRTLMKLGFRFHTNGRTGRRGLVCGTDTELSFAMRVQGLAVACPPEYQLVHKLDSRRINWPYLLRLQFANGIADTYFDGYRAVFDPGYFFLARSRLKHLAKVLRAAAGVGISCFPPTKGTARRLRGCGQMAYLLGRTFESIIHWSTIRCAHREILELCSRIKSRQRCEVVW